MKRLVIASFVLALSPFVASCGHRVTAEERAQARDLIEKRRAEINAIENDRRAALASTTMVPRPDLGKCPLTLHVASLVGTSPKVRLQTTSEVDAVEADALTKTPGARLRIFNLRMQNLAALDESYKSDRPEPGKALMQMIERYADEAKQPLGTLVIDAITAPSIGRAAGTYEGGTLIGRFFVYVPADKQILCASRVDVSLHGSVDIPQTMLAGSDSEELVAALEVHALHQAIGAAVRAGPASP